MNPDDPDPEGQTSTHNLSLVSPKPLYFPSPANIPILENQMDPSFEDASEKPNVPTANQDTSVHQASNGVLDEGAAYGVGKETVLQHQNVSPVKSNGDELGDVPTSFAVALHSVPAEATSNQAHALDDAQTDFSGAQNNFGAGPADFSEHSGVERAASNSAMEHYTSHGQYVETQDQLSTGQFDYQKLLDNLSGSSSTLLQQAGQPAQTSSTEDMEPADPSAQAVISNIQVPASSIQGLAGLASLPPRPPPQENANTPTAEADIRSYHIHDQHSSAQKYPQTTGNSFQPPGNLPPPILTAGAPGTGTTTQLPTSPTDAFQQQPNSTVESPAAPHYRQREPPIERSGSDDPVRKEDQDIPWGLDVQKQYDSFLDSERMYVTEGQWDKFPANSRLFIGNLPTEKVTKRDLFHVFHKHGKLAQISIKQAYGFIQYLEASSCYRALQAEQGVPIRGRKINLEISKPQKNTKHAGGGGGNNNEGRGSRNRRSRSPDYARGGGGGGGQQKGADRYRGGGNNRRGGRDEHRSGRSPSPRARAGRDDHRRDGDRYNGRRRSRSRSPHNRGRFRSPSPRRDMEDDLPLPRRKPEDVPDLQIIAKEDLDRTFISYVQKSFEGRGVRCNVLILSPRLSEPAVVRRQIIEGVLAVLTLDRSAHVNQRFALSVFDRSGGANNVRFEDYTNLELNICIELVLRTRQNTRQSTNPAANTYYGLPMAQALLQQPQQLPPQPQQQFNQPFNPQQPNANQAPFPSFDASSLQQILGRVQQQGSPPAPPQQSAFSPPAQQQQGQLPSTTDLSRILAGAAARAQPQPSQTFQAPATSTPYQNLASNPAFASLFGNAGSGNKAPTPQQQGPGMQQGGGAPPQSPQGQPQSPQQAQPDMRNIMAQLARYGR